MRLVQRAAVVLALAAHVVAPASARESLVTTALPALPAPVSNNAVAAVERDDGTHLVSLMGLGAGKRWSDTTLAAWHLAPGADAWRELDKVPGAAGRLASTAVGMGDLAYIFGGYTVAEDGSEASVATVHALDPVLGTYAARAPMPVPVDDTVALPYLGRHIYLVSGWHDTGNVNLVQRYDTHSDRWTQATPWPAQPLFGHAGGIVGNRMVVCDGVGIETTREERRFVAVPVCLLGEIDAENADRIDWTAIPHHPGPATYRMAATGVVIGQQPLVVFAGGSPNPYNYDGVGYDRKPSPPSDAVFAWHFPSAQWRRLPRLPVATMDHRGLPLAGGAFAIVGGMREQQRVTAEGFSFRLQPGNFR